MHCEKSWKGLRSRKRSRTGSEAVESAHLLQDTVQFLELGKRSFVPPALGVESVLNFVYDLVPLCLWHDCKLEERLCIEY